MRAAGLASSFRCCGAMQGGFLYPIASEDSLLLLPRLRYLATSRSVQSSQIILPVFKHSLGIAISGVGVLNSCRQRKALPYKLPNSSVDRPWTEIATAVNVPIDSDAEKSATHCPRSSSCQNIWIQVINSITTVEVRSSKRMPPRTGIKYFLIYYCFCL